MNKGVFQFRKPQSFRNLLGQTCSRALRGEEGSVESALVLVPTTILFLGVLQLSGLFFYETGFSIDTQSYVTKAALISSSATSGQIQIDSFQLPGGGSIILGTRSGKPPVFSPFLVNRRETKSIGIAIGEK